MQLGMGSSFACCKLTWRAKVSRLKMEKMCTYAKVCVYTSTIYIYQSLCAFTYILYVCCTNLFDAWNLPLLCGIKCSLYADGNVLPSCGRSEFACFRLLFNLMIFLCLFLLMLLLPYLWSPSPGSPDSSMRRFQLPASSCVQKLDHSTLCLKLFTSH